MYTYAPLSAQHGRPQSAYHQRSKKSSGGARNLEIVTTPKNNGYWKSNAIHGPVKVTQTPENENGGGIFRRMSGKKTLQFIRYFIKPPNRQLLEIMLISM